MSTLEYKHPILNVIGYKGRKMEPCAERVASVLLIHKLAELDTKERTLIITHPYLGWREVKPDGLHDVDLMHYHPSIDSNTTLQLHKKAKDE